MRILIDLTSLADNFSGIERFAACLANEMIKDSSNQYILLFKEKIHPIFYKQKKRDHVKMVVLNRCNKLIFNQVRLPLEIYKHKADVYLFMAFPVPIFLFRKNIVSTIHDICCWDCPETMNGMSKWYFRLSHRIAMLKCRKIITISNFSNKRIVERLKYKEDKIWTIYCGVDDVFRNYHHESSDLRVLKKYNIPSEYILSLSTLEPRKNLVLLVRAYEQMTQKNEECLPLVLAGRRGWKMDELLANIAPQVVEKIIFTGFIDDEDLPVVYGNSNLFVFPSMYEGFGIPPLEALTCGATVLSSDASSLPEVLGQCACYFKSDDLEDLRSKMIRLLDNRNREDRVEKEIIEDHLKLFEWKTEADKLLCYMKGLI